MKLSALSPVLVLAVLISLQGCAALVGAGVATGILVANDRRSGGTIVEDNLIKSKVSNLINEKYKDEVQVDLTSYNRVVLLYGQVPNQEIMDDIGSMALETQNVRDVQNEIVIAGASSFVARSNDAILTSKVKSRLMNNKEVKANNIKVVTDAGSVYLMGLVTRAEADSATQTAATTSGVKRVVKVFEFLD
jgi:osmotically-inducible protein OsmY